MPKESFDINPAGIYLNKQAAEPLYMQVYRQFREMITSRRLRPGDRLPASRNLAKDLQVSRVIISQGFEQLMLEGYIVGKTGSGTFVADVLPDSLLNVAGKKTPGKTTTTAYQPLRNAGVHCFQIGTPSLDQFPYKLWQQTGAQVLKELKAAQLAYADTLGHYPLRKAIAGYLRVSRGVRCEAEQVVVVTGSQQGLHLVISCLLKKGDKAWMEDPGYTSVARLLTRYGVKTCAVPVEKDGLNVAYGREHFADAALAYVTPSQQFPLGYTLSAAKRRQLLQWARQHNSWILEDDYDSEFRYKGNPLPSPQGMDTAGRVIYSGTFSKVLFPALRLAYLVLPSIEMVRQLETIKQQTDRQSPIIDQLITTRFMEEGHFLRHIRKMRLLYAERKEILTQLVQEKLGLYCKLTPSSSGMHLVCWLPEQVNMDVLKQAIQQQQLEVSFINDYTFQHHIPPGLCLGFTAFTRYQLTIAIEKLAGCFRMAVV